MDRCGMMGICAGIVAIGLLVSAASGIVVNYENDTVLAKAMLYDREMNGGDPNKSDRAMAEKYYIEYLKTPRPSFQQARVYAQIGALYAGGSGAKLAEKPDHRKAAWYGIQVLQAEPNRIGDATIRARTRLICADRTGFDGIIAGVMNYGFLRTVDANVVATRWLPRRPGDVPSGQDIAELIAEAKSATEKVERSLSDIPPELKDSEVELEMRHILAQYPNTRLARNAQYVLAGRGLAPAPDGSCSGKPSRMRQFARASGKTEAFAALEKLCAAGPVQVMHAKGYYDQKARVGEPNDKCAIWDMALGLRTIADIMMEGKLSQEEAFVLLQRLAKLKEKLVQSRPTGAVNIEMQGIVSVMMSGLALTTDWSSESAAKVQSLLRATGANDIDADTMSAVLAAEMGYKAKDQKQTKGELLKDAVQEQYPDAMKAYAERSKRELSVWGIAVLPIVSGQSLDAMSGDKLDTMVFAADYVTARRCMFAARAGLHRKEIKRGPGSVMDRAALLRKTVTADMDDFEREMLGQSEPGSESDVVSVAADAVDNGGVYLYGAHIRLGCRAGLGFPAPVPEK
jgi:hypothetical protein